MKANSLQAEHFPDLMAANSSPQFIEMLTQQVQPALKPMIRTQISERDQIEAIKHNLIISGMEENTTPEEDKEKFVQLIQDEMQLTVEVDTVERLGRKQESENPTLLRVVLNSMKTRKQILSKATTLRQSANEHVKTKIFIRPELTTTQLEE